MYTTGPVRILNGGWDCVLFPYIFTGPVLIAELQHVRQLALFFSAPERGVCSLYGVLQCLVRDTIRGAEWSTIAQSAIDFVRAASLTGEIAADALETRVLLV